MEVHIALGDSASARIDTLVTAMVAGSEDGIGMAPAVLPAFQQLHDFMYEYLYTQSAAKTEEYKVDGIVHALFDYYVQNPDRLPEEYALTREREGVQRAVCDYVAGMTDNFALRAYHELYIPRGWSVIV